MARLYRATELIAQARLKDSYNISTSDIDLQNARLQKLSQQARDDLERSRVENGKIKLPLFRAWSLLQELEDESLGKWFALCRSRMQNFLKCRNSSILAHGMKPIDEAIYRKEGQEGLILCREALAAIPASERKGRKVQQLPRKLPFETGGNK